ncbi:MAG: PqqD family peptide modification chaperone [Armatimonadia bacterium]|nr:PqqD family peptide modification chaperone [Armatimonadia bacterium]
MAGHGWGTGRYDGRAHQIRSGSGRAKGMNKALTDKTGLRGAEDVVFTAMQDEAVLLHLGTRKYYGLNETGLRIWQMIQVGANVGDVVTALSEEYEAEGDELREAVLTLIGELLEEGLVRVATASDGTSPEQAHM